MLGFAQSSVQRVLVAGLLLVARASDPSAAIIVNVEIPSDTDDYYDSGSMASLEVQYGQSIEDAIHAFCT